MSYFYQVDLKPLLVKPLTRREHVALRLRQTFELFENIFSLPLEEVAIENIPDMAIKEMVAVNDPTLWQNVGGVWSLPQRPNPYKHPLEFILVSENKTTVKLKYVAGPVERLSIKISWDESWEKDWLDGRETFTILNEVELYGFSLETLTLINSLTAEGVPLNETFEKIRKV